MFSNGAMIDLLYHSVIYEDTLPSKVNCCINTPTQITPSSKFKQRTLISPSNGAIPCPPKIIPKKHSGI